MPIPPLKFVDGTEFFGEPCEALMFDNSALVDWQVCKRLWQYKQLSRRTLVAEKAGRNFGSGFHRGVEHRYKHCPPKEPLTDAIRIGIDEAIMAWFQESPEPPGDFRNASHCQRFVREYNQNYPIEPFNILRKVDGTPFVESTFALPFGRLGPYAIVYTGKIDLGIEMDGAEWTFDHKTAFQFGKTFQQEMEQDGGQIGYVWAYKQSMGRKPRGYVINGARVRKPSKADGYSDSVPIDATDFWRIPIDVSDDNIDDWREDTFALIDEILYCHNRGYFPRSRKSCVGKYGACDFLHVCSLIRPERDGILLNSNLYEENTWTPLNKPE